MVNILTKTLEKGDEAKKSKYEVNDPSTKTSSKFIKTRMM